jgi:hypothetical protein
VAAAKPGEGQAVLAIAIVGADRPGLAVSHGDAAACRWPGGAA